MSLLQAQPLDRFDSVNAENPVLDKLSQFMDKHALSELANSFSLRGEHHIQKAMHGIENEDVESLHFAFHALKGSSGNVGLQELSNFCSKTEKLIIENDTIDYENLRTQLTKLIELFDDGKQGLQAYLAKL